MTKKASANKMGKGPNCHWSQHKFSKDHSKTVKVFGCPKGPKGKSKKPTAGSFMTKKK